MAGGDLGEGTRLAAATGAWVCFEDEAGQALKPAKARTRAPRGRTPVARVSGNSGRLSVAGMACLKAGRAGRFFCRVHLLPGYAPGRNAVEGAWASMKSSLGNHAARTLDELEAMVRTRLRSIQRRPDLINALLGQTGLTLEPQLATTA